jgi:hypothetical protein
MSAESFSSFEGALKKRYVGKTESLVPSFGICQKKFRFDSANKVGDRYEIHVRTANPHGVTAAGGNTLGTAYALNGARAGQTKAAFVKPFSMVLQEQVAYDLLAQAADEKTSYTPAMDEIVRSSVQSARFYQEMALLYGGTNIGKISANSGSSTTRVYTIDEETWAVGLWAQMQGAAVDVYDDANDGGTIINANTLVSVTSVNAAERKISVSGNATDLTDIDTAVSTGAYLKPRGFEGNWGLGVAGVLGTTTGSLFDIDVDDHGLWKPHQYSCGDEKISLSHILNASAGIVGTGGMCDITLLVSHWTFTDLSIDSVEFKRTNEKEGIVFRAGAKKIELEGAQGTITIEKHPMVKAGHALGICEDRWVRIGATDVTWRLQGLPDQFLMILPGNAGAEIRNYQNLAPFCFEPAKQFVMTDINNQSLS